MKSGHSNVSTGALDAAYRATTYVVSHPFGQFDLRVCQCCPELDAILEKLQKRDWAFVTACNPGSQPLPKAENALRHARLIAAVEAEGWPWLPGMGVPDADDWQPEASLLLLGIPLSEALRLASAFGQNAILAGSLGSPAQLHYVHGNPAGLSI